MQRGLHSKLVAGVVFGLVALFGTFGLLMTWAIRLSTEAALQQRQDLALHTAAIVDDLLDRSVRQLEALRAYVVWEPVAGTPIEAQPALGQLLRLTDTFDAVAVADRQGRAVWASGSGGAPGWSHARAVGEALTGGAPTVATILNDADGQPIAVVAVPLRTEGETPAGVLAGSLRLARMGKELLPLPHGSSSGLRTEVVNRQGVLLAASGEDRLRVPPDHLALLASEVRQGVPGAAVHDSSLDGGHVVAYAPFRWMDGGIFVEEPYDIALAVPRTVQRVGLLVGLTALLLVSLAAWWYASRITRPLNELTVAVRAMADEAFDRPVLAPRGSDELGLLTRSFEEMRARLKATLEERARWEGRLERRVRERTKAVHQLLQRLISAQEEERKRVARELHDGPAQDLAALLVTLDMLEIGSSLSADQERLLQRTRTQARGTLQEVRRLLRDLRPSALDDLGLVPAVRWFVETRLAGLGVQHEVVVEGSERRLPAALETVLFRVVQEAVTNAVKHAEPSRVRVRLTLSAQAVLASIEDDGKGFEPGVNANGNENDNGHTGDGFGLVGMRERVTLAGGTLEVQSWPDQGTRVRVRIPLEEDDENGE